MAMIQALIAEAERIAKRSLLLSPAPSSAEVIGWWRGENPGWQNGRPDDRQAKIVLLGTRRGGARRLLSSAWLPKIPPTGN
jgi:hypothetical protein